MLNRSRLRLWYDLLIGLTGVLTSTVLVILKRPAFPQFFLYVFICVISALGALWIVTFRSTILSFEIALFFFVTITFGPYVGSFTAMIVILLVWVGKALYSYVKKEGDPLYTLRAGFFNSGLYGILYLLGGVVYTALGKGFWGSLLSILVIIVTNEFIFVIKEILRGQNILDYLKNEALPSDFVELLIFPLGISISLLFSAYGFSAVVPVVAVILLLAYIGHQYSLYQQELKENLSTMDRLNEIQGMLNRLTEPQEILDYSLASISSIVPASFVAVRILRKLSYLSKLKIYRDGEIRTIDEEEFNNLSWDLIFNLIQDELILGELFIGLKQRVPRSLTSALENLVGVINASLNRSITYKESILDGLTGLYTRRFFEERIKSYIAQSKREKMPFTIVLFDVDKLKYVNDTFGHLKGDELLVSFSKILREHTRESDLCARWGGDEFVVVLYGVRESEAESIARRVVEEFGKVKFKGMGGEFVASCTYACKQFDPEFPATPQELFYLVDSILIAKKKNKQ
ncbi:MAG: GGDEF domain-containing protein [candidate division WOR-3 bacterium]